MSETKILPVFLRQNRDYVQGTQMIARAAESLDGEGWVLDQALFLAMTDRLVTLSEPPLSDADLIGHVKFLRGGEQRVFYFGRIADAAPLNNVAMPIQVQRLPDADKTAATYDFSHAVSFEDLLNVVVQSIKAEHEHVFPNAFDIWLTGVRNFHLAVGTRHPGDGKIRLVRQRIMVSAEVYQSLWSVALEGRDGFSSRGFVTFAFKSEGQVNVR